MPPNNRKIAENDFISEFEGIGPAEMARKYNMQVAGIYKRRAAIEQRIGRQIRAPDKGQPFKTRLAQPHPGRIQIDLRDGYVLVGSDAHYWPGIVSTAHRAFVYFAKKLQPKIVVMNGDAFDGASISRHPPINWTHQPSVIDEIETVKERLTEIERAAPNAKRYWPLGNHDARFESRLATVAHEYAKVHGFSLKDHLPYWHPCWSLFINDDVVIKHRIKGGIHAGHNNTVNAGRTTVTGHLHSGKVTPFADYNGNRWGVDTGTLADPYGPQFDYQEDGPRNHRSGFAILRFVDGELLDPQFVRVKGEGRVVYCNEIYDVGEIENIGTKRASSKGSKHAPSPRKR